MTGVSPVTPSGTFGLWPRVRDDRLFFGLIAGLVVLAWLSLWLWQQSPYARFLGHEEIGGTGSIGDGYLVLLALFVGGWTLMTVAMMLPTSLPLVAFFRTLVRRRSNRVWLVALLVLGYVGSLGRVRGRSCTSAIWASTRRSSASAGSTTTPG